MAEHPPLRTAHGLTSSRINHGFFGRQGGVSTGIYASLNCGLGSRDTRENALENRRRAAGAIGAVALNTAYQCHSADVLVVTGPWSGAPPRGDAMVTRVPRIALGVLAADCSPVLFSDAQARVIGVAHAGWRGALDGVLEATVRAMESEGAQRKRIVGAIGPCIGMLSYEVGPEFQARFQASSECYGEFFVPAGRNGHFLFDLEGFVRERLLACGLACIETVAADTYAEEASYFSYRRATHRNEQDYGRNLSAIVLGG